MTATLDADQYIWSTFTPYEDMGSLYFQNLTFAAIDGLAVSANTTFDLGVLSSAPTATVSGDVLIALQSDYANRVSRGNLSQYRMAFLTVSVDAEADTAIFERESLRLNVDYLIP